MSFVIDSNQTTIARQFRDDLVRAGSSVELATIQSDAMDAIINRIDEATISSKKSAPNRCRDAFWILVLILSGYALALATVDMVLKILLHFR